MKLNLVVAVLTSSLLVSGGVIPLTEPLTQKISSIKKETPSQRFYLKQNSIHRLAHPGLALSRGQANYEGFFEEPLPERVDYSPEENVKLRSWDPNVPRELIYSGILQIFNGPYFYAINALKIGYPGIPRYSDSESYDNEIESVCRRSPDKNSESESCEAFPNPLVLADKIPTPQPLNPTINYKGKVHQALYGKTALESCEALSQLLVLDGLVPVHNIPTDELSTPKTHYIAAVVQDRKPAISNQKVPYEPKYFRLNAGGIWSYKIGMEANQVADHQPFTSSSEAVRELTRIAMLTTGREDIKGRFCGFFKVTEEQFASQSSVVSID